MVMAPEARPRRAFRGRSSPPGTAAESVFLSAFTGRETPACPGTAVAAAAAHSLAAAARNTVIIRRDADTLSLPRQSI